MNIAIFSPNKNPYSETFIQAHKNYLNGNIFYYYGEKNNINLEGKTVLISKIEILRLRLIRKLKNKPFDYINQQILLSSLKKNEINIIIVEYGTHAFNLKNILQTSKLPFIVHFHGFDASVKQVIKRCNNYREIFKSSSKIIVVSRTMKLRLEELGCPKQKLLYNVYGPDPSFYNVEPKYSKKQFVAIGRFTDKKAPYYTIMAFKNVITKHPDAKLLMAGDGFLLNMCQNIVRQYNLEDHVKFLNVIKPEVFRKLLSESLAFVQHSITAEDGDMEGTPVAVLEASIAGLPIVSTNHAGIPDVVIHEKTGLLCDEHDVGGMSKNMIRLLDNIEYARLLGQQGKKHIKANYSMDKHIDVLNKNIKSCI